MAKLNKWSAGKIINNFSRADDVNVSEETSAGLETIGLAHAAAGNTEEMAIIFATRMKMQSTKDITDVLNSINQTNAELIRLLKEKK